MTITHEILRHLDADLNRPVCYIVDGTGKSTPIIASQLLDRASQFAGALAELHANRSIVAIALYHGIDLYAAFLGALLSNNIPSMVAPPSPRMEPAKYKKNLIGLIENIKPNVLISEELILETLPNKHGCLNAVKILSPKNVSKGSCVEALNVDLSDIAVIQHSSGTTGQQKGISLTHEAILKHNFAYSESIGLTKNDIVASWLPLYHDMGFIAAFLLPLISGIPFVQMSQFDWVARPYLLLQAISRHRATLCWMPNFAFSFMAERVRDSQLEDCKLSSLRALINCSEPVSIESLRRFVDRFGHLGFSMNQVGVSYAMAENVFAVTQTKLGFLETITADLEIIRQRQVIRECKMGKTFVSNGPTVPGTHACIFSAEGQVLPDRHIGEIAIRGQTLFSGYFERPDLTAQAMTNDGWYLTGDLGFMIDGNVFVSGRKKDVIIIQGRNFALSDVESLLVDIQGLNPGRLVAFGVEDQRAGTEKLIVVAETNLPDEQMVGKLKLEIRTRISQAMDCTAGDVQVFNYRWLVKSTAGKLSRSENRQKYLDFLRQKMQ